MPMRIDPYAKPAQRLSPALRALALVLLLHAGAVFVLHNVMPLTVPPQLVETISAQIVSEFKPPELAKHLPPPLAQPAPVLPAITPTPLAQAPSAFPSMAAVTPQSVPPVATAAPVSAPTTPSKLTTLIPASRVVSSCALPRYPAASERLREEGVVMLRFLIGENGQVLQGQIDQSSGYKRLDDAALAALSLCKFKPATVDGQPKQDWSALRYRWELKDD